MTDVLNYKQKYLCHTCYQHNHFLNINIDLFVRISCSMYICNVTSHLTCDSLILSSNVYRFSDMNICGVEVSKSILNLMMATRGSCKLDQFFYRQPLIHNRYSPANISGFIPYCLFMQWTNFSFTYNYLQKYIAVHFLRWQ